MSFLLEIFNVFFFRVFCSTSGEIKNKKKLIFFSLSLSPPCSWLLTHRDAGLRRDRTKHVHVLAIGAQQLFWADVHSDAARFQPLFGWLAGAVALHVHAGAPVVAWVAAIVALVVAEVIVVFVKSVPVPVAEPVPPSAMP